VAALRNFHCYIVRRGYGTMNIMRKEDKVRCESLMIPNDKIYLMTRNIVNA